MLNFQIVQIEQTQGQTKRNLFRTMFSRGNVQIEGFVDPEPSAPIIGRRSPTSFIKFNRLKQLLLISIILAITLTVLFIVKQITVREQTEVLPQSLSVDETVLKTNDVLSKGSVASDGDIESRGMKSDADSEPLITSSTTTMTTASSISTTRATTTSSSTTLSPTTTSTSIPITSTPIASTSTSTSDSPSSSTPETTTETAEERKVLDHLSVTITIKKATVPNRDAYVSKTDTYVKVYADEHFIGQTPVQKETLTPEWNYQIARQMTLRPESVIRFELYDNDKYTSHEFIGKFVVTMSELMADGSNGQLVSREHGSGQLWFTVSWDQFYRKA